MSGEKSSTVDGMPIRRQPAIAELELPYNWAEEPMWPFSIALRPYDAKVCAWMKLCGGAVKIAFDHENGHIIMETNLAAEICCAAEDIIHQVFRGH